MESYYVKTNFIHRILRYNKHKLLEQTKIRRTALKVERTFKNDKELTSHLEVSSISTSVLTLSMVTLCRYRKSVTERTRLRWLALMNDSTGAFLNIPIAAFRLQG